MNGAHALAVALATVGAVLFGLAAIRQHGAVLDTMTGSRQGLRQNLRAFGRLVRQPTWLIGTLQGIVAGGLHVVALALAPITLVQPLGVLAVPVTVVASSLTCRQRPSRAQVWGSVLSVGGIALLTVLLLTPATQPVVLPAWGLLALTGGVSVGATVLAIATGARSPRLLRCVVLAGAAAVLFGLNSILIRILGHVLSTGRATTDLPVLVTAAVVLAVALPVGVWAMQSAYLTGSPHVVICCLTLLDPVTAVVGGWLLVDDGVAVTGWQLPLAVGCALLAAAGVVLLSREYPADTVVAGSAAL